MKGLRQYYVICGISDDFEIPRIAYYSHNNEIGKHWSLDPHDTDVMRFASIETAEEWLPDSGMLGITIVRMMDFK